VVQSGCGIIIFGGGNPAGDFGNCILQIASKGSMGLNNSGDTVTLYDVRGRVIDQVAYGSIAAANQSIVRNPEIGGVFVKHSEIPEANDALFSPGTQSDGSQFEGCLK
jgi:hypothetical protein